MERNLLTRHMHPLLESAQESNLPQILLDYHFVMPFWVNLMMMILLWCCTTHSQMKRWIFFFGERARHTHGLMSAMLRFLHYHAHIHWITEFGTSCNQMENSRIPYSQTREAKERMRIRKKRRKKWWRWWETKNKNGEEKEIKNFKIKRERNTEKMMIRLSIWMIYFKRSLIIF